MISRNFKSQKVDFSFEFPHRNTDIIYNISKNVYPSGTLREKCPYSQLFWSVFSRIQFECAKVRTRITPNTDTLKGHANLWVEGVGSSASEDVEYLICQ